MNLLLYDFLQCWQLYSNLRATIIQVRGVARWKTRVNPNAFKQENMHDSSCSRYIKDLGEVKYNYQESPTVNTNSQCINNICESLNLKVHICMLILYIVILSHSFNNDIKYHWIPVRIQKIQCVGYIYLDTSYSYYF